MSRSARWPTRIARHGSTRRNRAAAAGAIVVAATAVALEGAAPGSASEAALLAGAAGSAVALQHAALAARGRARRRYAVLDGAIDPGDPAVAAEVERLAGPRARRALAAALRRAVADAGRPRTPALVHVYGRALRDPGARAACLVLADELERAGPADTRLVLRAQRLVREGGSSLHGDSGGRLAEDAAALARGLALAQPARASQLARSSA